MSIETEVVQLEPAPATQDPSLDNLRVLGEKVQAYGLVSREEAEQVLANGGSLPATAALESFTEHLSYTNVRPALESIVSSIVAKVKEMWKRFMAWLGGIWKRITDFWSDVKSKHRRDAEAHLRYAKMAELIRANREFIRRVKQTVEPARVNKVCVMLAGTPSGWMNASPDLLARFYPSIQGIRSIRDAFMSAFVELEPAKLGTDPAAAEATVKGVDARVRSVVYGVFGIHESNRDDSSKVAAALRAARDELEIDDSSAASMEPEAVLTVLERKYLDLSRAEVAAEGLMTPEVRAAYEKLNADWNAVIAGGDQAAIDSSIAALRAGQGLFQMMSAVDAHLIYGHTMSTSIDMILRDTAESLLKAYPRKAAGQDSVDMLTKALRGAPVAAGPKAPVISINVSP